MNTDNFKGNVFAITTLTALFASCFYAIPQTRAEGFIDDSTLKGGVYYWQRDRSRKDLNTTGKYEDNLKNSTVNVDLNFSSGYWADIIGFDLAGYAALELGNGGPAHPDEIGFSNAKTLWQDRDQGFSGDSSGMSLYKAALKLKIGPFWARAGYIQPTGQTLLAANWSFMPGTYRGAEVGAIFDYGSSGVLSVSYLWADQYKAPWYKNSYEFRKMDSQTKVDYQHSIGAKYDFKNDLILEAAYGEAQDYMNQYFAKASYKVPVAGNKLAMSYQFYAANDEHDDNTANDVYDGLAWLQALTFGYTTGPLDWRLEGTWVRAEGSMGNFLHRMTTNANSASNGRLDIWWDSRSDFNANGEKAVYAGVVYDLSGWDLTGWKVGTSYAYGWDAKPNNDSKVDQNQRVKESAWNADIMYTVQSGRAKDTLFKLHYTRYDNHSNNPSWSNGYNNMFQDEKDIKFIVMAPFTIF